MELWSNKLIAIALEVKVSDGPQGLSAMLLVKHDFLGSGTLSMAYTTIGEGVPLYLQVPERAFQLSDYGNNLGLNSSQLQVINVLCHNCNKFAFAGVMPSNRSVLQA